jgi:hypothetical protein
LPDPIGTDPVRLVLSSEEEARVRRILVALPEEAADVHAAVTRLLFDVIGVFEGRLVTPSDVDETLIRLADAFLSLLDEDRRSTDAAGTLALLTRHAMVQARSAILRQLAWARRN